jgi:hypothetical protein
MHYKPIDAKNAILGKDFNLGASGSFFVLSPIASYHHYPLVKIDGVV